MIELIISTRLGDIHVNLPVDVLPEPYRSAVNLRNLNEVLESMGRTKAERIIQLENAIRWALGENGDFPPREEGQGAYWWRTELRRRAGL